MDLHLKTFYDSDFLSPQNTSFDGGKQWAFHIWDEKIQFRVKTGDEENQGEWITLDSFQLHLGMVTSMFSILTMNSFVPSEKEMATHSSVLAWRIPGMGEPGGPLSMGLHRVGPDWSDLAAAAAAAAA